MQVHQHTHTHFGIIMIDRTLYATERTWGKESHVTYSQVIFPFFLITFPLVSSTLPQRHPSPTTPTHPTSLNHHQSPLTATLATTHHHMPLYSPPPHHLFTFPYFPPLHYTQTSHSQPSQNFSTLCFWQLQSACTDCSYPLLLGFLSFTGLEIIWSGFTPLSFKAALHLFDRSPG